MSAVLTKLATPKALPGFPDADKNSKWAVSTTQPNCVGLCAPLAAFSISHVMCITTRKSIQCNTSSAGIVLLYELFFPVLILLGLLIGALTARFLFGLFAVLFILGAIFIGLIIVNYIDDVFILTNKRIIDIERHFVFLFEEHDTATYEDYPVPRPDAQPV